MGLSPVTRFKTVEKYWCDENPRLRDTTLVFGIPKSFNHFDSSTLLRLIKSYHVEIAFVRQSLDKFRQSR